MADEFHDDPHPHLAAAAGEKPRLLITGAAGRFGRCLVGPLNDSYELVLTDAQPGTLEGQPVQALDIRDFEATRVAMAGVDYVVHLAIANPYRMDESLPQWQRDDELMQVGLHGTQHVFEAARQAGVRRVVFASSLTVYPTYPPGDPIGPDTPTCPQNLYACTKKFGEEVASLYARLFGLPSVCLRFGQPYPHPRDLNAGWRERMAEPRYRMFMLGSEDLVQAVRCGLDESGPKFAIANIVSACDVPGIDLLDGPRLGYKPRQLFTAEGCTSLHEKGETIER